MSAKPFMTLFCLLLLVQAGSAQSLNSKVGMQDATGKKYTGVITSINGDKYYVKYDGFDFGAWLTRDQFVLSNATDTPPVPTAKRGVSRFDLKLTAEQEAAVPEVKGGMPVLAGTAWVVASIYEKGATPTTQFRPANFLFCRNGQWEHQTGSLFLGGTYTVNGTTLLTKDGGVGKAEPWKLRWDGSVKELEMEQGHLVFVLRYVGKTQC